MSRNLVIIGNGLGLSVDPTFFILDRAMAAAWDGDLLHEDEKYLIRQCLSEGVDQPEDEKQLRDLQRVVDALDTITSFENRDRQQAQWLTDLGASFPNAIRYYLHAVASEFHSVAYDPALEPCEEFLDTLDANLRDRGSTIATTNYDGSLYRGLCDRKSFKRYHTLDGFQNPGPHFSIDNLGRSNEGKGYYFHLHGSPLFVDRNGRIEKLPRSSVRERTPHPSKHIVLTDVAFKTQIINRSPILSAYWRRMIEIKDDFDRIVWFGHSGRDPHLNAVIARHFPRLPITVVEWSGIATKAARTAYWNGIFPDRVTVVHLDDLTEFRSW